MPNCKFCPSPNKCTLCENGKFLISTNSSCISNCATEDTSKKIWVDKRNSSDLRCRACTETLNDCS